MDEPNFDGKSKDYLVGYRDGMNFAAEKAKEIMKKLANPTLEK